MVLPAATHYETDGVYVSMTGRAQRLRPGATPPAGAAPGWELLIALSHRLGAPPPYRSAARAFAAAAAARPALAGLDYDVIGVLGAPVAAVTPVSPNGVNGPREAAGTGLPLVTTTRIFGNAAAHRSEALAAVRTGAELVLNPAEGERLGLADGARARLRSPHGECTLTVRLADDHPAGAAFVTTGVPGAGVERLLPADRGPVNVEIEAVVVDERFLVVVIKAAVVVFVVITAFAYTLLWERKLIGRFQARYGPNRAGPVGYLQPLADVVKLIFKEDFVPQGGQPPPLPDRAHDLGLRRRRGDRRDPVGRRRSRSSATTSRASAPTSSIGVLFLFALSGLGFYGLILGGWASGNKYSLLGAARTAAQLVSYEVAMGLSVIGVIMMAQSLSLVDIVHAQADTAWYILFQPLGFLIFVVAAVAETNRAPFDMPEAESELVAGYHTEYGGLKFAMFFLAEYINMIIISALGATLFLGGFSGPFLPRLRVARAQGRGAAVPLHLAARHAAPPALRPPDEARLEGAAAAGDAQPRGDGDRRRPRIRELVSRVADIVASPAASQNDAASSAAPIFPNRG